MPKVSIITASYNYAQYIGKTIESVINQTFQDWEMLIIDDGSTDNSIDIINKYVKKDHRIRLYSHLNNKNLGLIETIKLGFSQSKGEYIVFLESDDYIKEDYLQKKLETFDKYPNAGFIYNDIETIGIEQSVSRKHYFKILRNYWKKHNTPHFISELFYLRNYIPTFSCVMLKKELLSDVNWESPEKFCIDWWLWAQISQKTNFYFIPEKLTFWRLHKNSYLDKSKINNANKIVIFHNRLYEMLPPIKHWKIKIKFIQKQLLLLIKYRKNTLKNIKHAFKR